MADDERKPRRLQVATMRPDDSGRGIARLPRATPPTPYISPTIWPRTAAATKDPPAA